MHNGIASAFLHPRSNTPGMLPEYDRLSLPFDYGHYPPIPHDAACCVTSNNANFPYCRLALC